MRMDDQPEVDEYLWPLTGELSPINWEALAEELRIRERLAEIMAHVRTTHVRPRLRRVGPRVSAAAAQALTEAVIAGPSEGPPWLQTLKEPVPRVLREEWSALTHRLCALEHRRSRSTSSEH
jgi:hypothetical protein